MTSENNLQPDVADVLKRIREQLGVHARKEFASKSSASVAPRPSPTDLIPALRQLLADMQVASYQIGQLNPRHPGVLNWFVQGAKRLLQRVLGWYTRPIVETQAIHIRFLAEATKLLEYQDAQIRSLQEVRALLQAQIDWISTELETAERKKQ
jgi:hypothetical protein